MEKRNVVFGVLNTIVFAHTLSCEYWAYQTLASCNDKTADAEKIRKEWEVISEDITNTLSKVTAFCNELNGEKVTLTDKSTYPDFVYTIKYLEEVKKRIECIAEWAKIFAVVDDIHIKMSEIFVLYQNNVKKRKTK